MRDAYIWKKMYDEIAKEVDDFVVNDLRHTVCWQLERDSVYPDVIRNSIVRGMK